MENALRTRRTLIILADFLFMIFLFEKSIAIVRISIISLRFFRQEKEKNNENLVLRFFSIQGIGRIWFKSSACM